MCWNHLSRFKFNATANYDHFFYFSNLHTKKMVAVGRGFEFKTTVIYFRQIFTKSNKRELEKIRRWQILKQNTLYITFKLNNFEN